MTTLKIAKELSLPLNAVTQKLAWLGTTGSGKTYGASKFIELIHYAGAQYIILDPVGVWYGLRLKADGKTPSDIDIPIFGGLHGDVPLEPTAGALIANLIVDRGISAIIDVSQFESDAQKARFARDFGDKFFFRKKAAPSAVHLLLEEAQEFVPQNPEAEEKHMLHAFVRIQKLGRNFGIGSGLISQRPQEVNKKALNQAQTLFVFRTTGTHERKAIEQWIKDKSLDENIANDLPKIPTGQCHVWSPEFLKISEQVHILGKRTFNASATPEVGAKAVARHLAPIDLEKIKNDIAATIERAKAEDPRALRAKIADLQKQINATPGKAVAVPAPATVAKPKIVEVPALKKGELAKIKESALEMKKAAKKIEDIHTAWGHNLEIVGERIQSLENSLAHVGQSPVPAKVLMKPETVFAPMPSPIKTKIFSLSTAQEYVKELSEYAILLIQTMGRRHPMQMTRGQLAILSGRSVRSSAYAAAVAEILRSGMVKQNGKLMSLTDSGLNIVGGIHLGPQHSAEETQETWRRALPGYERGLLDVLLAVYPEGLTREELAERAGKSIKSSAYAAAVANLIKNGLADNTDRRLTASKMLFE